MIVGHDARPLVFLDVDGPLIPFRRRRGKRRDSASDVTGPASGASGNLGLPDLPVVEFPDTDDEPVSGLHWKTMSLTRWAAGRTSRPQRVRGPRVEAAVCRAVVGQGGAPRRPIN
jgi:hypothetical protein